MKIGDVLLRFKIRTHSHVAYSNRFFPVQTNKVKMMHACAVWCMTSLYTKTSVFVRPHENDYPAFSNIPTASFQKTSASEYDDVVHIYLLAFHMLSTVFMWTGENYSNTLRVDAYFLMITALVNGLLMRRTENFLCWRIWRSCAVCQFQLSNNNIKCNETTVNKKIQ